MRRWTAVALLLLAVSPGSGADSVDATFSVGARVPARLTLTAIEQPGTLELRAHDIERGYVDLSVRYSVSTNDPSGYLLRFVPRHGYTSGVEISGPDLRLSLVDSELEVLRADGQRVSSLELRYRLHLHSHVVPGRYPLPVEVSVSAL
jgi:hypothetical protein